MSLNNEKQRFKNTGRTFVLTFSMTRLPPNRVTNSAGEATVKSLCRSIFLCSRPFFTKWRPDMLGLQWKSSRSAVLPDNTAKHNLLGVFCSVYRPQHISNDPGNCRLRIILHKGRPKQVKKKATDYNQRTTALKIKNPSQSSASLLNRQRQTVDKPIYFWPYYSSSNNR